MTPEEIAILLLQQFIDQNPGAVGLMDATTFKARYVEFASIDDATINIFLAEALLYVDASWPDNYIGKCHGLATAHLLKVEGYGSSATIQSVGGLPNLEGITKFKIDDLEVNFSTATVERANTDSLTGTSYGRQFKEFRDRLFGGGIWAV